MKKAIFAFLLICTSTGYVQETKANQKVVCCASEKSCDHPKYGKVYLSTLEGASTCS